MIRRRAASCRKARAVPSGAEPARSNGGTQSVRVGVLVRHPSSQVEIDLAQPARAPYEDVNVPLHRQAVEPHRCERSGAQTHRKARPRWTELMLTRCRRPPKTPSTKAMLVPNAISPRRETVGSKKKLTRLLGSQPASPRAASGGPMPVAGAVKPRVPSPPQEEKDTKTLSLPRETTHIGLDWPSPAP